MQALPHCDGGALGRLCSAAEQDSVARRKGGNSCVASHRVEHSFASGVRLSPFPPRQTRQGRNVQGTCLKEFMPDEEDREAFERCATSASPSLAEETSGLRMSRCVASVDAVGPPSVKRPSHLSVSDISRVLSHRSVVEHSRGWCRVDRQVLAAGARGPARFRAWRAVRRALVNPWSTLSRHGTICMRDDTCGPEAGVSKRVGRRGPQL